MKGNSDIIWLTMITILLVEGYPRCDECYQDAYYKTGVVHTFKAHHYLRPQCYKRDLVQTCTEDGVQYWMAPVSYNFDDCPKGEEWVCWRVVKGDIGDMSRDMTESDMIRETVVTGDSVRTAEKEHAKGTSEATQVKDLTDLTQGGKNLFVDLAERIASSLNVTKCWVCGGPITAEEWPWRGTALSAVELLKWGWKAGHQYENNRPEGWILSSIAVGRDCLERRGSVFDQEVGETPCKRVLRISREGPRGYFPGNPRTYWSKTNQTDCEWIKEQELFKCKGRSITPFSGIREISKYWEGIWRTDQGFWKAPEGLFWICGRRAYTELPNRWAGSCTIGIIQPGFFLLPLEKGNELGVPVYDDWKRQRREVEMGGTQQWGSEIWTPQRIIETYGPATWAQDGSWGYRTPIYMLNRIIRLQAVLEMITNETAQGWEYYVKQHRQSRAAIYQNRLALDYLLAEEGGVCGKFNSSDCCLQIDDHGEAILNMANNIRKLAHVPPQEWTPILKSDWWADVFSGSWWKKVGFIALCVCGGLLFLPCLIPCVIRLITSVVQGMQVVSLSEGSAESQAQKLFLLKAESGENRDRQRAKELLKK
ncbi:hypothetical protein WISP_07072 [Willisornis vidua]|uniref:ENR1 protein n=1 Tax=Willisornis vidua TaxID=1566151 RepID=A0ABQ9DSL2_9PASS|nr:hypothetical protein WISP_07072 [Willisornis vidua]